MFPFFCSVLRRRPRGPHNRRAEHLVGGSSDPIKVNGIFFGGARPPGSGRTAADGCRRLPSGASGARHATAGRGIPVVLSATIRYSPGHFSTATSRSEGGKRTANSSAWPPRRQTCGQAATQALLACAGRPFATGAFVTQEPADASWEQR